MMKFLFTFLAVTTIVVCEANLFNLHAFGGLVNRRFAKNSHIEKRNIIQNIIEKCGRPATV